MVQDPVPEWDWQVLWRDTEPRFHPCSDPLPPIVWFRQEFVTDLIHEFQRSDIISYCSWRAELLDSNGLSEGSSGGVRVVLRLFNNVGAVRYSYLIEHKCKAKVIGRGLCLEGRWMD